MRLASYVVSALAVPVVLCAQLSHPVMVSRDDAFSAPRAAVAAADTLRILAVMVQFQPDNDARTTGDGQFVLSAPTDSVLDAPPHDIGYVRDHLTFVEGYFRKASRGKLIIQSTVVDSIYTLPTVMAAYSPPKKGAATQVADLARDTWRLVDSSGKVSDFSRYDCFIVVHAGAGRDIDLAGTLGYDPTPLDIPSLYFGLNGFRSVYGAGYQGIPVSNGTFYITNTIVVPETESRFLPGVGGDVPLRLSINGLLCASVGNFLGLPDLFDTNTGRSGIGRFGLMDGQAIFSFSGAFPPEPSAWEKYWLGWVTPIVVAPGVTTLTIPAASLADTVYSIPIGGREYYLLENRNRDALRNGQTVTTTFNGVTRQYYFPRDTVGFDFTDVSRLAGVVIDVDDLDWSLPGFVDVSGVFYDGGLLLWHVDETVIAQTIGDNRVNADPQHRGVDLEEADGSQDIGQQYGFFSAGSGSEEGTPLDYWFRGNSAPVYRNEFSPTSFPNSYSYAGANSHVTIRDISVRGPRMTAVVARGDNEISPLQGFPRAVGEVLTDVSVAVAPLGSGAAPHILITTQGEPVPKQTTSGVIVPPGPRLGKLYAWKTSAGLGGTFDGLLAKGTAVGFSLVTSVKDLNGDAVAEVLAVESSAGSSGSVLHAVSGRDANSDSLGDELFQVQVPRLITTSVLVSDSLIAFGCRDGVAYFLRFDGSVVDTPRVITNPAASITGMTQFSDNATFLMTGSDGTVLLYRRPPSGGSGSVVAARNVGRSIACPAVAGLIGGGGAGAPMRIVVATGDGFVYMVDQNLDLSPGFPVSIGEPITAPPALADVDADGIRDIVVFGGKKIFVFNYSGVTLDNFPVTVGSAQALASSPVIADVDVDGLADVIAVSADGLVVAHDRTGRMVRGFPLQAGTGPQSAAVLAYSPPLAQFEVTVLVVGSASDGTVSAWSTGSSVVARPLGLLWPQYLKDAEHTGYDPSVLSGVPLANEFFPAARAYNWPNPAYGTTTNIRYFVRDNATVSIRIFDLAGDLVAELPGPGVGGVDNEVVWDLSGIQSGVYFARIEANGAGGSGVAIVKVAVVK